MRLLAGRALRLSVALAGMLTAAGAFAHAHLQQQIPTAGAQLSASPQTLTLSFSEGIEPAFSGVTVTGLQQHAVATGKLTRSADIRPRSRYLWRKPCRRESTPWHGMWSRWMVIKPKGNIPLA